MMRELRRTIDYPHPRERVWRALTDAEALAVWLMPNDFAPRVGHLFHLRATPAPGFSGLIACEVLELREPERMVWSWRTETLDSLVVFTLEATARGTRLRFRQTGFAGLDGLLNRAILEGGVETFYRRRLADYLAGAPPVVAGSGPPRRPPLRVRLLASAVALLARRPRR